MRRVLRIVIACIILITGALAAGAQDTRDSLVRLVSANMARITEINGETYRKVVGDATFFHNNTYLRCDSAYWNVNREYIVAIGSVRVEQGTTVLTGDSLRYHIPSSMARFRGHLVELRDGDSNVLRTNHLDYNTKDSIAVFHHGAAMRDTDGNIIESILGEYDATRERFEFNREVEMFSDSMFFACNRLVYESENEFAEFFGSVRGWYGPNHISSEHGWYDRAMERFFFNDKVHMITAEQEIWCDSLFYNSDTEYSRLLGNVQLQDTVNNVISLAGEVQYWSSPRRSELYRSPAMIMIEIKDGVADSTFIAADTLRYYSQKMFEVDSAVVAAAKVRRQEALIDPLAPKTAPGAGAGASESPGAGPAGNPSPAGGPGAAGLAAAAGLTAGLSANPASQAPAADTLISDSLAVDSLAVNSLTADSLTVDSMTVDSLAVDSLAAAPLDTTEVNFMEAWHDVRIYMSDMQIRCDSLLFSSLDSIARFFVKPVIWYEVLTQISADSMQFVMRDGTLNKGLLFSNSFVASEATGGQYYHQIKSPEMSGYFTDGQITRFDAMGGVTSLFYVEEDSVVTTMNQKECRVMSSYLKNSQLHRILYTGGIKSDAYPVWELTPEMARLRDFAWMPELRPATRFDVTPRGVRPSGRSQAVRSSHFPTFRYTAIYFGNYMEKILKEIDARSPLIWK